MHNMRMTDLTFSDIQALQDSTELGRLPVLNISILRNITIEQIEPYLRYLALKIGFNARVRFGQYDNILQDAARRFKKVVNATALIWKVLMVTEKRFRKLNAPHLLSEVYEGIEYRAGKRVANEDGRAAA